MNWNTSCSEGMTENQLEYVRRLVEERDEYIKRIRTLEQASRSAIEGLKTIAMFLFCRCHGVDGSKIAQSTLNAKEGKSSEKGEK